MTIYMRPIKEVARSTPVIYCLVTEVLFYIFPHPDLVSITLGIILYCLDLLHVIHSLSHTHTLSRANRRHHHNSGEAHTLMFLKAELPGHKLC